MTNKVVGVLTCEGYFPSPWTLVVGEVVPTLNFGLLQTISYFLTNYAKASARTTYSAVPEVDKLDQTLKQLAQEDLRTFARHQMH